MAGTLILDTIKSSTTSPPAFQNTSGTEIGTLCRAWVNFNGTLTSPITPRAGFNISSVTKSAAGTFTVNFTNSFADTNYGVSACGGELGGASNAQAKVFCYGTNTGSVNLYVQDDGGVTLEDHSFISVSIFR